MRIRTIKNGNILYKPLVFDLDMLETIRGDNLTWSLSNKYPALKGRKIYLHNFIQKYIPNGLKDIFRTTILTELF